MQSILESTNGVYRLEDIPRPDASRTLARLENHQKSVEAIDSLSQVATENVWFIDIRRGGGRVQIIQLVRVGLAKGLVVGMITNPGTIYSPTDRTVHVHCCTRLSSTDCTLLRVSGRICRCCLGS